jgi:hypothetical protein
MRPIARLKKMTFKSNKAQFSLFYTVEYLHSTITIVIQNFIAMKLATKHCILSFCDIFKSYYLTSL